MEYLLKFGYVYVFLGVYATICRLNHRIKGVMPAQMQAYPDLDEYMQRI